MCSGGGGAFIDGGLLRVLVLWSVLVNWKCNVFTLTAVLVAPFGHRHMAVGHPSMLVLSH